MYHCTVTITVVINYFFVPIKLHDFTAESTVAIWVRVLVSAVVGQMKIKRVTIQ
jgi:hypothetical protein